MQLFSLTSCMIAKVREKVKKFKDYYWGCQSKSFFFQTFSGIWIHRVGVVNSTKFVSGRSAVQSFFLCFSCCSSGANKKKLRKYNSKFWNIFPVILFKKPWPEYESSCVQCTFFTPPIMMIMTRITVFAISIVRWLHFTTSLIKFHLELQYIWQWWKDFLIGCKVQNTVKKNVSA